MDTLTVKIIVVIAAVIGFNLVFPPFVRPAKGQITSRYSIRKKPEAWWPFDLEAHPGIDIANANGTVIRTTKTGFLHDVGGSASYGNYVEIYHWFGFSSFYAHLSRADVREGQFIIKGMKIARMGSTGRSTGSHVHFEIRWLGCPLPPGMLLFYDNIRYVAADAIAGPASGN